MSEISPIEYVYGVGAAASHDEPWADFVVVPFRITRKTAKRIYYIRRHRPDGTDQIGFVDRLKLEAAGDEGLWARRTAGWWEDDNRLYLSPPPIHDGQRVNPAALQAEVDRLRAEMAAVHPDRGGTDVEFIAAHKRYDAARDLFRRILPVTDATSSPGTTPQPFHASPRRAAA